MSEKQYVTNELAQIPKGTVALAQGPAGQNYILLPLQIDASGNLKVAVTGAGSGGTSAVDESAFSAGVSAGTPLMGVVTPGDTPPSGDLAIAALAADRSLKVSGSFSAAPPSSNTSNAVAQTNVTNVAASILASNAGRKGCRVKNTGTTVLKIGLGQAPTQTAYHVSLYPGASADDGAGDEWDGTIGGALWTGQVNAISSTTGGTCVVTELT